MSKPVIKLNQPVRITSIKQPDAFANKKDRVNLVGMTGHFTSLISNLYEDNSLAGDFVFSDGTKTFFHRVFVKPV